jgi:hypothetical protein
MATSDSDSTHLDSRAAIIEGSASASTAEANAAGIGSFRTYRSRWAASYIRSWSGPARINSEAFGFKIWRRRAPPLRRQPSQLGRIQAIGDSIKSEELQHVDIHPERGPNGLGGAEPIRLFDREREVEPRQRRRG